MARLPEVPRLEPKLPPRPRPTKDAEMEPHRMGLAYVVPAALAAPVIVLTVLGAWGDARLHWGWLTPAGAVLGFVCGLVNMVRITTRLGK